MTKLRRQSHGSKTKTTGLPDEKTTITLYVLGNYKRCRLPSVVDRLNQMSFLIPPIELLKNTIIAVKVKSESQMLPKSHFYETPQYIFPASYVSL